MTGVIALAAMALLMGGLYWWSHRRQLAREADYPKHWLTTGELPPAGLDVALAVIRSHLIKPWDRWGGVIIWTKEPFIVNGTTLAAGTVDDDYAPRVRVMFAKNIWETALAHEIGHVMWLRVYKTYGEGAPEFQRWVRTVNSEIQVRLTTNPLA